MKSRSPRIQTALVSVTYSAKQVLPAMPINKELSKMRLFTWSLIKPLTQRPIETGLISKRLAGAGTAGRGKRSRQFIS